MLAVASDSDKQRAGNESLNKQDMKIGNHAKLFTILAESEALTAQQASAGLFPSGKHNQINHSIREQWGVADDNIAENAPITRLLTTQCNASIPEMLTEDSVTQHKITLHPITDKSNTAPDTTQPRAYDHARNSDTPTQISGDNIRARALTACCIRGNTERPRLASGNKKKYTPEFHCALTEVLYDKDGDKLRSPQLINVIEHHYPRFEHNVCEGKSDDAAEFFRDTLNSNGELRGKYLTIVTSPQKQWELCARLSGDALCCCAHYNHYLRQEFPTGIPELNPVYIIGLTPPFCDKINKGLAGFQPPMLGKPEKYPEFVERAVIVGILMFLLSRHAYPEEKNPPPIILCHNPNTSAMTKEAVEQLLKNPEDISERISNPRPMNSTEKGGGLKQDNENSEKLLTEKMQKITGGMEQLLNVSKKTFPAIATLCHMLSISDEQYNELVNNEIKVVSATPEDILSQPLNEAGYIPTIITEDGPSTVNREFQTVREHLEKMTYGTSILLTNDKINCHARRKVECEFHLTEIWHFIDEWRKAQKHVLEIEQSKAELLYIAQSNVKRIYAEPIEPQSTDSFLRQATQKLFEEIKKQIASISATARKSPLPHFREQKQKIAEAQKTIQESIKNKKAEFLKKHGNTTTIIGLLDQLSNPLAKLVDATVFEILCYWLPEQPEVSPEKTDRTQSATNHSPSSTIDKLKISRIPERSPTQVPAKSTESADKNITQTQPATQNTVTHRRDIPQNITGTTEQNNPGRMSAEQFRDQSEDTGQSDRETDRENSDHETNTQNEKPEEHSVDFEFVKQPSFAAKIRIVLSLTKKQGMSYVIHVVMVLFSAFGDLFGYIETSFLEISREVVEEQQREIRLQRNREPVLPNESDAQQTAEDVPNINEARSIEKTFEQQAPTIACNT